VIDRDPVEPGAKVGLHPIHEIAGGRSMIWELDTLLGRHDEAELVAVVPAPFDERTAILDIPAGRIDLAPLPVLRHAITLEIAKVRIDGFGADELPPSHGTGLGIELHDTSLDRNPPRARADATVAAPWLPVLQRGGRGGTTPPLVKPATSLPGVTQAGRIAASPSNSLLNLPVEAGRAAATATNAALANPRATAVPDPAGPETEIVVIARHDITIGRETKACKRQNTGIAAWRRKDVSCVASEGLPRSDGAWSIEN